MLMAAKHFSLKKQIIYHLNNRSISDNHLKLILQISMVMDLMISLSQMVTKFMPIKT